MPITRLGLANPSANSLTTLVTAQRGYVAAVIIANKNNQTVLSSVYLVPTGAVYTDATAATIVKDLEIGAGQSFETVYDIDFSSQYNGEGQPNSRIVRPNIDANGIIQNYTVTKREVVLNGLTKVFKRLTSAN